MSPTDFEDRARRYAALLPGIVRAALLDQGISEMVQKARQIGWDGRCVTVPVRDHSGRVAFFERWTGDSAFTPVEESRFVELYPWSALEDQPPRIVIAEGIHETLVLESQGITAISATGSGLFFKSHDWGPALGSVPQVVIAFRRGEKLPRRRFLLSRGELAARIQRLLPRSIILTWPEEVGPGGGAFDYFVRLRRTGRDFENLLTASCDTSPT